MSSPKPDRAIESTPRAASEVTLVEPTVLCAAEPADSHEIVIDHAGLHRPSAPSASDTLGVPSGQPTKRSTMDHASTVRRLYDLINAGDIDRFDEVMADDFVEHEDTPGLAPTKEGVKEFFRMYRAAFPDLRMDPEDVLASGDKVVARVRVTGTQQGELMGMPATGKRVDVQLIDIIRFGDDGLAHEHWGVFDALAMMQQLGAVPDGGPE